MEEGGEERGRKEDEGKREKEGRRERGGRGSQVMGYTGSCRGGKRKRRKKGMRIKWHSQEDREENSCGYAGTVPAFHSAGSNSAFVPSQ